MSAHRKENLDFVERAEIPRNFLEGVKELYLSKQEERDIKKYPEWDVPRISPAFELIKTFRDLNISENKLREKWNEQEIERKEMDAQWKELREQELIFRESFIKYNNFVKENQEKRQRSKQKILGERERQKQYQTDIENLQERLNYMKGIREKMEKYVGIYKKYQDYLEKVISETKQFRSITEIFERYENLIEVKRSLSEQQEKNIELLEETEAEIYRMTEAKSQTLIRLNNKLSTLQGRYEKAKIEVLKWEMLITKIKEAAIGKYLELARVKDCSKNIYHQICKRKERLPILDDNDIEHQLLEIKHSGWTRTMKKKV
ncbi:coiled-coil domain-containing protein 42 homolog isoform X2 [Vespa mandarinia]|uniref:coiled-coil domain-containing protein 42 homolog isoform X2 n=1 Tax=Vespa mandarinia TaxID=7446 RepID=UPI0016087ED7|nr:coiled-coil domain-containing protein 42 homolog isoform X2 [Vespa mandarinia]XP_035733377.1 coiled-coil domain-containing protein 42 homolog isoform X2 [Vespa mandarinia]XP_035733378.1 coiled-coil domain-containing protein 42 homolog isoform X2 [Vespa mandarinia]